MTKNFLSVLGHQDDYMVIYNNQNTIYLDKNLMLHTFIHVWNILLSNIIRHEKH